MVASLSSLLILETSYIYIIYKTLSSNSSSANISHNDPYSENTSYLTLLKVLATNNINKYIIKLL